VDDRPNADIELFEFHEPDVVSGH